MVDGIRIKVCGITTLVDAELADKCGADYAGFNLYPKSPRFISLEQFQAMKPRLPDRKTVAIAVEPTVDELAEMDAAGFDYFQIHFRHDFAREQIAAWSKRVGAKRLWLAPKLPPVLDVSTGLLPHAKFFLLDTFSKDVFGGTGKTGDWAKFARHQTTHPDRFWILSGGLNAENIGDALRASGARFVDVNSGVESVPGVKDPAKLKSFVVAVHKARAKSS